MMSATYRYQFPRSFPLNSAVYANVVLGRLSAFRLRRRICNEFLGY